MEGMLIVVGILIALSVATSITVMLLGIADLIGRRWKQGLLRTIGALGVSVATVFALGTSSAFLIPTHVWDSDDVTAKAKALAENISGLMNIGTIGLPAGLVTGAAILWRRRRARRVRS